MLSHEVVDGSNHLSQIIGYDVDLMGLIDGGYGLLELVVDADEEILFSLPQEGTVFFLLDVQSFFYLLIQRSEVITQRTDGDIRIPCIRMEVFLGFDLQERFLLQKRNEFFVFLDFGKVRIA